MPDKSIFSEFTNLYPITKTIRFNLLPVDYNPPKKSDFRKDITNFVKKYKIIIKNFKEAVFVVDIDGEIILNPSVNIRLQWIKNWAKQDFHSHQNILIKYDRNGRKTSKSKTTLR